MNINPNKATFSCQSNPIDFSNGSPRCYQPSQIQKAYNVTPLLRDGKDGRGRTIVIVDAYDPYIRTDLNIFNQTFDLRRPTSARCSAGVPAFDITDPNQVGWAEETTLDVLWAHAIAPGAKIVLVQATSNEDTDILAATQFAINHHLGDVLSQSFGEAEHCVDPAARRRSTRCSSRPRTSTGPSSPRRATPVRPSRRAWATAPCWRPARPASDPLVTGVGGTTLDADIDGAYQGETAWTEVFGCNPPAVDPSDVNCSGGGFSDLYPKPAFQKALVPGKVGSRGAGRRLQRGRQRRRAHALRGLQPDGRLRRRPAFFLFGGTSAGTPQWAAIAAIARPGGTPPAG